MISTTGDTQEIPQNKIIVKMSTDTNTFKITLLFLLVTTLCISYIYYLSSMEHNQLCISKPISNPQNTEGSAGLYNDVQSEEVRNALEMSPINSKGIRNFQSRQSLV